MRDLFVLSLCFLFGIGSAEFTCRSGCGFYTCTSGVGFYCCDYCDCCLDIVSAWWFWLVLVLFIVLFAICGGCFYRRRYRYRYAVVRTANPIVTTTATTSTYNYGSTQPPQYDQKPPPYNPMK